MEKSPLQGGDFFTGTECVSKRLQAFYHVLYRR